MLIDHEQTLVLRGTYTGLVTRCITSEDGGFVTFCIHPHGRSPGVECCAPVENEYFLPYIVDPRPVDDILDLDSGVHTASIQFYDIMSGGKRLGQIAVPLIIWDPQD